MAKYVVEVVGANDPTSAHYEGGCGEVHTETHGGRIVICEACAKPAEAAGDVVEVLDEAPSDAAPKAKGRSKKAAAVAEPAPEPTGSESDAQEPAADE